MNILTENVLCATVVWWNSSQICMQCPYCLQQELLTVDALKAASSDLFYAFYQSSVQQSSCGRGKYICGFPFDEANTGYEVDIGQARYVNVDNPDETVPALSQNIVDDLADSLSSKAKITDSLEPYLHVAAKFITDHKKYTVAGVAKETLEEFLQTDVLFFMYSGSDYRLRKDLEEIKLTKLQFVTMRDEHGSTALINASGCSNWKVVDILLEIGADVNASNNFGRTPLMEAAHWGHFETVKMLLKQGAKTSVKDRDGKSAFDLAQPTRENQTARFLRSGGRLEPRSSPRYLEDTFTRDEDRRKIVLLLQTQNKAKLASPPTAAHCNECRFAKDSIALTVVLREPTGFFSVPDANKTVARLKRGPQFKDVSAMSGWGHEGDERMISGKSNTSRLISLCRIIQYILPEHQHDQGVLGQWHACHAEKQLIMYYLDRHIFPLYYRETFPHEIVAQQSGIDLGKSILTLSESIKENVTKHIHKDLLASPLYLSPSGTFYGSTTIDLFKKTIEEPKGLLDSLNAVKTSSENAILELTNTVQKLRKPILRIDEIRKMQAIRPPTLLTSPAILISSPICKDCQLFTEKVNQHFGVSIRLYYCS